MRAFVTAALLTTLAAAPGWAIENPSSGNSRAVRFYAGFAAAHVGDERSRTADHYDTRRVTRGLRADIGVFVTPRLAIGVELLQLPRVESEWSRNEIARSWTGEEETAVSGVVRYALLQWRPLALETVGGIGAVRANQRWELSQYPYYSRYSPPSYYGEPAKTVRWRRHTGLTATAGLDLAIRPERHISFGPQVRLTWIDVDRDAGTGKEPPPLARSSVRWSAGFGLRVQF